MGSILCLMQEALTCIGSEELGVAVQAPAMAPWANLALAAIVVVVGVIGLLRVRTSVRQLRAARVAPPEGDAVPYLAGAGLGLVCALSLLVFGRPVGASGAFEHAWRGAGMTWPMWLIAGVAGGGLLASLARRDFRIRAVPESWATRHGPSVIRRFAVTFVAAALMEVAALIAGGCTSGLGLSGGIGLAPGAFVFMAAMFATGVPAAWLAHGRRT